MADINPTRIKCFLASAGLELTSENEELVMNGEPFMETFGNPTPGKDMVKSWLDTLKLSAALQYNSGVVTDADGNTRIIDNHQFDAWITSDTGQDAGNFIFESAYGDMKVGYNPKIVSLTGRHTSARSGTTQLHVVASKPQKSAQVTTRIL